MKILIPAALAVMFLLQACNGDNKSTTDSKMGSDTAMKMTEHNDAEMDGDGKMNMNNELMKSMMSSMDKMKAVKMNGDFDAEFAAMMIEHHQGAIDMANIELKSGSDNTMKAMAQSIITAQKAEIEKFKTILASHKENIVKGDHPELMEAMSSMDTKTKETKMTGNVDKDFAMMMKVHHSGAIEMSKGELGDGKVYELKKMAQQIIEEQNKEVKQFDEWLATQK
ncbi:DUF305 domain-containing protein [Parasediminibacterium paludis]|uniref:DUF305 domain-containing protein n=1 Tax=Parasediminibacterium paludis TaxID=908966 RepID=A0ABV8Q1Y3_9BACT